jgi:hypothetical protein
MIFFFDGILLNIVLVLYILLANKEKDSTDEDKTA